MSIEASHHKGLATDPACDLPVHSHSTRSLVVGGEGRKVPNIPLRPIGIGRNRHQTLLGSLAFNMMREEWKELRAEVKEMRHRIDEMPDGATLNRLADDVQDLSKRVGRLETQINNWDE